MKDDPIARAARALRETADGSSARAAASRRRIVARAVSRRRRRNRLLLVLAPVAAVLVVSSAWAAVTGRLGQWIDALRPTSVPAPPAAPRGSDPPARTIVEPPPPPAREGPDADVEAGGPPQPSATVASTRPVPPLARVTAPSADAAIAPSPPSVPDEEALYYVAHRAHFVAHDPGAALRAWEAYLAAYPDGRFALEARYNRALSLVRLGRLTEAKSALAPFADGRAGGYRAAEARELLDVLEVDGGR
ncbi:MAG TPA: hypothetical protein VKU41_03770 [Polyangiaceae bacterium]|nr:hypothetical protein [Polyangiaceae bacterium]